MIYSWVELAAVRHKQKFSSWRPMLLTELKSCEMGSLLLSFLLLNYQLDYV